MGIRNLNRYLKESCPDSIRCINLVELSGKRIAVDISIYLYRYEAENALLENMYVMLSIFRHYNIIPIFIFDGKPPPEKYELLKKRQENKTAAKNEYNKLITASKSLGALKGFELTESELKELNNIKKEESYYILETKQKNVMENVDNNDIPDFDDDEIYGGRRKPKKKPTNATMNMKDIKRLCKANQIKLSKTKDGIRIIYTKKELITKLKRKKIL